MATEINPQEFVPEKSLIKRLQAIMLAIAIFFLVGFFGIYFSSLSFLKGLQKINTANKIFNLTTQTIETLDTSAVNLEKIGTSSNVSDVVYSFNQSQKIMKDNLREALAASEITPEVMKHLRGVMESVRLFEESANIIFKELRTEKKREKIKSETLVALQFALEGKELLRKAQITLRNDTDTLFKKIYQNRFQPLIVTISLSIFFFTFVVTFGFTFTRHLGKSINNLINATERVKGSDLTTRATIIEADEIGKLTFAFNNMVQSLSEGRNKIRSSVDKLQRLQAITASFSEALTVSQVCDVTVQMTFDALNAHAGAIAMLSPDGSQLEVKSSIGLNGDEVRELTIIPMTTRTPMVESIRYAKAIFIESSEELHTKFPELVNLFTSHGSCSALSIPLIIGSSVLGAISFYFDRPRNFGQEDKDFVISLARQCSQAIHRSQLYDEAKSAIKVRDEFLSIASHELKTPLTPLKLQLQMLSRQLGQNPHEPLPADKMLKIMDTSDKQLGRLSRLIEDLLDVSRITSGKLNLNKERFNLAEVVHDVVAQYGKQLKDALKNVEIYSNDVEGEYDRVRMEQVLINLLTNAAKYAPGKPIKVKIEKFFNWARLSVSDQGPGIAKENRHRIFDRFERIKDKDNIGGLGLGLFISNQIVTAHGGKIWVESEMGKGSTFIVEVPLS